MMSLGIFELTYNAASLSSFHILIKFGHCSKLNCLFSSSIQCNRRFEFTNFVILIEFNRQCPPRFNFKTSLRIGRGVTREPTHPTGSSFLYRLSKAFLGPIGQGFAQKVGNRNQGWAIIFKKILFKEDWFCEDKL